MSLEAQQGEPTEDQQHVEQGGGDESLAQAPPQQQQQQHTSEQLGTSSPKRRVVTFSEAKLEEARETYSSDEYDRRSPAPTKKVGVHAASFNIHARLTYCALPACCACTLPLPCYTPLRTVAAVQLYVYVASHVQLHEDVLDPTHGRPLSHKLLSLTTSLHSLRAPPPLHLNASNSASFAKLRVRRGGYGCTLRKTTIAGALSHALSRSRVSMNKDGFKSIFHELDKDPKDDRFAPEWATEDMRANRAFVLAACRHDARALEWSDESLRK